MSFPIKSGLKWALMYIYCASSNGSKIMDIIYLHLHIMHTGILYYVYKSMAAEWPTASTRLSLVARWRAAPSVWTLQGSDATTDARHRADSTDRLPAAWTVFGTQDEGWSLRPGERGGRSIFAWVLSLCCGFPNFRTTVSVKGGGRVVPHRRGFRNSPVLQRGCGSWFL